MTHCRKCGAELVPVTRPTSRHDVFTGALTQHEWDVCPNWRPRWVFGNGHDWWHRGTNPIDRVMPHRPDPMIHENPPRPPVVR